MAQELSQVLEMTEAEMLRLDESPTIDQLGSKQQLYYDDVAPGDGLPRYIRRRSLVEYERWCITMENTHRAHYDHVHAVNHDRVPGPLFQGTWRTSIICAWLKNWSLPNGWLWKASWQVRAMVVPGEITILWGEVKAKEIVEDLGLVHVRFGIVNQDGIEGAPGTAVVALPRRDGEPIPYPFIPPTSTVPFWSEAEQAGSTQGGAV